MADEIKSDIPEIKLPDGGFQSSTPKFLLEGKNDSEKYLLDSVGKINHYIDWSAEKLVAISQEVRKTNGRVNRNSKDIEDIKLTQEKFKSLSSDLEDIVNTKRLIEKVFFSKIAWAGVSIFLFGLYHVIKNPELRETLLKFF